MAKLSVYEELAGQTDPVLSSRLHELLSRWESDGMRGSASDLAADDPKLLQPLQSAMDRLRQSVAG